MPSTEITTAQVEDAIKKMGRDLRTNPNPEAIKKLREEYGVTFDITGELIEVRQPRRLRKAVKAQLEDEQAEREGRAKKVGQSISAGASKTGEVVLYGLVDAPIEGAKTAKAITKGAARHAKETFVQKHEARLVKADERKVRRAERKQARADAKAAEAEAEKQQAKVEKAEVIKEQSKK